MQAENSLVDVNQHGKQVLFTGTVCDTFSLLSIQSTKAHGAAFEL